MKKENNKIVYLEILRIIACYLVLVNHSADFIYPNSTFAWVIYYSRFMLCKVAIPIFFMISDYLLLKND